MKLNWFSPLNGDVTEIARYAWTVIDKLKTKLIECQSEYDDLNSQLETQQRLKRNI